MNLSDYVLFLKDKKNINILKDIVFKFGIREILITPYKNIVDDISVLRTLEEEELYFKMIKDIKKLKGVE